jgi:aldose 1-epimerase
MAPYSNRIGYRHFRWLGRDFGTAPNFEPGYPHSLHGTVWKEPWRVAGANATQAELAVTHLADEHWPSISTQRKVSSCRQHAGPRMT